MRFQSFSIMETGIKGTKEVIVTDQNTAIALGSGTLRVFATPAMVALVEETAWRSVADALEEGQATVGTLLNIAHTSPTPIGAKVRCETVLTEIDSRRLVFKAEIFDEKGLIGSGTHERFVINEASFAQKAEKKKQ